jgi:hypothetical protein
MKKAMAETFYDKDVHLLNKSVEIDAEGGVKTNGYTLKNTFKGNVNFTNCEKIQEEYGLDYKVNVSITTDHTGLDKGDIFAYDKVLYEIKGIYVRDSHTLVLGTICRA